MKKIELPYSLVQGARQFSLFQDFTDYSSGGQFTSTLTGSGTATISQSIAGGILAIAAVDSVANRENAVATTNPLFLFASDHSLIFETFINFTEASTNQFNM